MKKVVLILVLNLSFLYLGFSQITDNLYLDENGSVTNDLKTAEYILTVEKDKKGILNGYANYYNYSDSTYLYSEYYKDNKDIIDIIFEKGLTKFNVNTQTTREIIKYFNKNLKTKFDIDTSTFLVFFRISNLLISTENYAVANNFMIFSSMLAKDLNLKYEEANVYYQLANYIKSLPDSIYSQFRNLEKSELIIHHLTKSASIIKDIYGDENEIFLNIVLEIYQIQEKRMDLQISDILTLLFLEYLNDGNYEKALIFAEKSLAQAEIDYGIYSKNYALSLNNLGVLHFNLGNYEKVEEYWLKALEIKKQVLGENNIDYAMSLNNIGFLYQNLGLYKNAEEYLLKALVINKQVLGEDHKDYAMSLNNIGLFYYDLGNLDKAEEYLLKALEIRKKVLGENNIEYAASLSNISTMIYINLGKYKEAEEYLLKALEIRKQIQGENHTSYVSTLSNIGNLYHMSGKFEKAEECYLKTLEIRKQFFGEEHLGYAAILENLGALYLDYGKFEKVEECYRSALDIKKKKLGVNHPNISSSLRSLGGIYYILENYEKADSLIIESNLNVERQVIQSGFFMSEKEREQFLKNIVSYYFSTFSSYYFNRKNKKSSIIENCYNNELIIKGLLLRSNIAMRQAVTNSNDNVIIELFNNYLNNGRVYLKLQELAIEERFMDIDSLSELINNQEKELFKSEVFKNHQKFEELDWEKVQNNLKINEVSIEFCSFNYYNSELTDSILYCALLVTPECEYPEMIYLCEEKQLDSVFNTYNEQNPEYFTKLYNLIISPLDSILQGSETIYFSPSGLLNNVSFTALKNSDNKYLGDLYNLVQLSSTALVATEKEDFIFDKTWNTAIFGGANFGIDSLGKEKPFEYLNGTYNEATEIQNILKSKSANQTTYIKLAFTEEAFKKLAETKSPEIIHIGTHGFYNPDSTEISKKVKSTFIEMDFNRGTEETYVFSENPLLRSGLAMADANKYWSGNKPIFSGEDGVLTAYEISHTYLGNTNLVVLSACQTGLGEIKGTEGVFGLQRAFKMAGVDYLLMSLWSVPDEQTKELMTEFYQNFINGKEIREAFKLAQNKLKTKYPNEPYYWAGFVLVE